MNTWSTAEEQKPEANGRRLDDAYWGTAARLDDLELAAHAFKGTEQTHVWTLDDLTRFRRAISNLDAVGARVERNLK